VRPQALRRVPRPLPVKSTTAPSSHHRVAVVVAGWSRRRHLPPQRQGGHRPHHFHPGFRPPRGYSSYLLPSTGRAAVPPPHPPVQLMQCHKQPATALGVHAVVHAREARRSVVTATLTQWGSLVHQDVQGRISVGALHQLLLLLLLLSVRVEQTTTHGS
jgi:hypothetical protein